MGRLEGKIALITGGSRGIGAETAKIFAKEGAQVIIADILEKEGEQTAKETNAKFYKLDVSKEDSWNQLFINIKNQYKRLDILFNNAAIVGISKELGSQNPEEMRFDTWKKIHQINLDSIFLGCRNSIALMKNKGGSIINMSSRCGVIGVPSASAYASSKSAVRNFTKSVALYCAEQKYNIRCNAIIPGAIFTPIWQNMEINKNKTIKDITDDVSSTIPLGHMGEPLDVAYAAVYLGSDESKYVTGTELVVDGGILAGGGSKPELR